MTAFKLNEISAVDAGAQEDALAILVKRAEPKDEIIDKAAYMTSSVDGHAHTISTKEIMNYETMESANIFVGSTSYGTSGDGDEYSHSHPWVISESGQLTIGESNGHTHEIEVRAMDGFMKDVVGKATDATDGGDTASPNTNAGEPVATSDDVAKDNKEVKHMSNAETNVAEITKQLEDVKAELAQSKVLANMSDAEKSFMADLADDDKESFVAKSADERLEVIKNAQDEDGVIYKSLDGTEFRKSQSDLADMAKRADDIQKQLDESVAKAEKADLEKSAESELGNLSGEVAVRGELLKAARKIGDEAVAILKGANEAMSDLMVERGSTEGDDGEKDPNAELEAIAKRIAADDKIDYLDAYEKACEGNPELYKSAMQGDK